jgi:hypothetical protein
LLTACPSCGKRFPLARATPATKRAPEFEILECKACQIMLSKAPPAQTNRIADGLEYAEGDAMMRRVDEYWRYANEAQEFADRSLCEEDKAGWLRIAKSWLSILQEYPATPEAEFEAVAETRGTGQARSTSMH